MNCFNNLNHKQIYIYTELPDIYRQYMIADSALESKFNHFVYNRDNLLRTYWKESPRSEYMDELHFQGHMAMFQLLRADEQLIQTPEFDCTLYPINDSPGLLSRMVPLIQ